MPDLDVPCSLCAKMIKATVANPHIVNMYAATMIIIEHPIPAMCPHCNKPMVVTVQQVSKMLLKAVSPLDVETSFDFRIDSSDITIQ